MSTNPLEVPGSAVASVVPPPVLDYTAELGKLGLQAEDVTPDLLTRFQEALRRYQSGTDANLALLEERVYEHLDEEAASTTEKIVALTSWIEVQETDLPASATTATEVTEGVEAAVQETTETLEAMRTRLTTEASTRAQTAIEARLANIPFFGEMIAGWLVKQGTELTQTNATSGIGGKIQTLFIGFIAGMFGVQGIFDQLKTESEAARIAVLPVAPVTPPVPDTVVAPAEELGTEDTETPEGGVAAFVPEEEVPHLRPKTRPEDLMEASPEEIHTRKRAYSRIADIFLKQIAGESINTADGESTADVFPKLEANGLSWKSMREQYYTYIDIKQTGTPEESETAFQELARTLGLSESNITEQEKTEKMLRIALGKNIDDVFTQRVTPEVLETLRNDEHLRRQFGSDFLSILNKSPEDLTFSEGKMILMMTLPGFLLSTANEMGENVFPVLVGNIENIDDDLQILGEDLHQRSVNLLPPSLVTLLITGGTGDSNDLTKNDDEFRNLSQSQLAPVSGVWENSDDERGVEKLIRFKNDMLDSFQKATKFHLGLTNLTESLKNNLSYKEVLGLYSILDGNHDLESAAQDALLSSLVFVWIHNTLPVTADESEISNGIFMAAITRELTAGETSTLSPAEVSIILNNGARGTNAFFREYLSTIQSIRDGGRETVREEVSDHLRIELTPTELSYIEYAALAALLLGNAAIGKMKLPFHIKVAVTLLMSTVGVNWAISILYENKRFEYLQELWNENDIYNRVNEKLSTMGFPTIAELAESSRNGIPFKDLGI